MRVAQFHADRMVLSLKGQFTKITCKHSETVTVLGGLMSDDSVLDPIIVTGRTKSNATFYYDANSTKDIGNTDIIFQARFANKN